jgi:hypothetical protein
MMPGPAVIHIACAGNERKHCNGKHDCLHVREILEMYEGEKGEGRRHCLGRSEETKPVIMTA